MYKKLISILFIAIFLASCISVSVESEEPARANFVTATLVPTREGFVPPTLTRAPEATQTLVLASPAPAGCTNSAVLLRDVTIPDNTQVHPGEKFTKTWEFQNNGTCPWVDYTLGFAAGDQMSAPLSAPIQTTLPGGKVNVSVELTAPSSNGTYIGYFTLNDASGGNLPIGIEKTFWVKVITGSITIPAVTQSSMISTPYVPGGGNSNCAYSQNAGYVQQLIALINQARASMNLHTLTVNAQLMSAAQAHSGDMACNNFLGHTGSNGSWIGDRLSAAGYHTYNYEEIIAIGTPQNAMEQWASDAPHWESVLNPNVTQIGVGYAYYASSDFGGYITVDFGG
jgi:uncharacterized protein YkwD